MEYEYKNRTRNIHNSKYFFITVFQDIEHRTTATHDMFRDTISVCNKGRTRYVMPPLYTNLHDITVEFASAVCHLPVDYDKDAYGKFLDTWGTVCIIKIILLQLAMLQAISLVNFIYRSE